MIDFYGMPCWDNCIIHNILLSLIVLLSNLYNCMCISVSFNCLAVTTDSFLMTCYVIIFSLARLWSLSVCLVKICLCFVSLTVKKFSANLHLEPDSNYVCFKLWINLSSRFSSWTKLIIFWFVLRKQVWGWTAWDFICSVSFRTCWEKELILGLSSLFCSTWNLFVYWGHRLRYDQFELIVSLQMNVH